MRTVESYDSFGDEWQRMPSMTNGQVMHGLVAARSKLFVIGCRFCEVFDSRIGMFAALKSPSVTKLNKALMIGSKIKMFRNRTEAVLCYDVDKNEWTEEKCQATKNIEFYSCVKVPLY